MCIPFVQAILIVVLIKSDLWWASCSFQRDLITFFIVLLLVKTAEWVHIARSRDTWEASFALASELELTLDLFNHHFLESQNVSLLEWSLLFSRFGLLARVLVQVNAETEGALSARALSK